MQSRLPPTAICLHATSSFGLCCNELGKATAWRKRGLLLPARRTKSLRGAKQCWSCFLLGKKTSNNFRDCHCCCLIMNWLKCQQQQKTLWSRIEKQWEKRLINSSVRLCKSLMKEDKQNNKRRIYLFIDLNVRHFYCRIFRHLRVQSRGVHLREGEGALTPPSPLEIVQYFS